MKSKSKIISNPQSDTLRILILEDVPTDAELVKRELRNAGITFTSRFVDTRDDFLKQLEDFSPDIVLSDYSMPQFNGMEALELVKERYPSIPLIIVTGSLNEETATECIKAGADDYVIKEHLTRLGPAVNGAMEKKRLRGEKERVEKRIKHLNLVLYAIRSVNQLIVREKDPDRLIQDTCANLIETRGFLSAWIALLDENGEITTTAESGLGEVFLPMIERLKRGELTECAKRALAKPDVVVIKDPSATCLDCPLAGNYYGKAGISIRIEHGGKVYGLLTISTPIDFMTEEELSLFKEIAGDISFALHAIEIEKESNLAKEVLQRSEFELRKRNRISNIFLTTPDEEMYGEVLQVILDAMESKYGIFGYINEQGSYVCPSMTRDIWDQCQVPDKDIIYPRDMWSGIWGRALIEKKTLYSNEPLRVPEGHLPIHRVLVVPIIYQEKVIGLLQVANKDTDYDEKDKELLESIAGFTAPVLNARLQRDRQEGDKKKFESQLIQSQKMEAIGTLSGGIAHDFNNILGSILGYTELSILGVPEGSKLKKNLTEVFKAGKRAKTLIQQILAFSRKQELEQKPLQLKYIVKESLKLLRSTLPTDIEIKEDIAKDVGVVNADPTQMQQVIMNLCTNAGHAMQKEGGVLTVGLANVELDDIAAAQYVNINPGPYLRFSVSDTGDGITPDVKERIFEPYFTTKAPGAGTGLGLSVVHGIVKSHGGTITVYSEQGKGSTFHVYLPLIQEEAIKPEMDEQAPILTGNERILFIDDEPTLVEIGTLMLDRLGYKVTTRTSSIEALELFREKPNKFDLVITDMTMPKMTGDKLAQELMKIRPDIPIIICTGYSGRISEEKAIGMGIKALVMKPLMMRDIANTVRKVLDEKKEKPAEGLILVIDDDDQFRGMLRQTLEHAGYEVTDAPNGKEGIRVFRENPADLVITDIIMPEKEGIETIKELRRDFPDVKIIAISGGGRIGPVSYLKMAKGLGAQCTLTKPIEREELLKTVMELINE